MNVSASWGRSCWSMRLDHAYQASLSASLRASVDRTAAARTDDAYMVSRSLAPMTERMSPATIDRQATRPRGGQHDRHNGAASTALRGPYGASVRFCAATALPYGTMSKGTSYNG